MATTLTTRCKAKEAVDHQDIHSRSSSSKRQAGSSSAQAAAVAAAVGPVASRSISQVAADEWVGSDYAVNMTMPSSLYLLRIPPLHYYILYVWRF
jgi:hypothetical protein